MTKKELRNIYKQKRAAIPPPEKLKLDDLLLIQFQRLGFGDINLLLTYWPMAHTAEPNTHLFSGYLRHTIPGLQIAYPVADFSSGNMQALLIDEGTVYATNKLGITEPKEGMAISPAEIDIVFVPMLVCDMHGFRVGYGKGFYDKYLSQCRSDIIKTGFSYFAPVARIDDADDYDVPLNYCITPDKVYEF